MGKHKTISLGQRFGKLVVVSRVDTGGRSRWLCQCDCGKEKTIEGSSLNAGRTISCNCAHRDGNVKHGHNRGGGKYRSTEYNTWSAMKDRCLNPNNKKHYLYGGRGITVCPQWITSFSTFLADMGLKPSSHHSIDRIDNDGNYEPGNCRWATIDIQNSNKSPKNFRKRACGMLAPDK